MKSILDKKYILLIFIIFLQACGTIPTPNINSSTSQEQSTATAPVYIVEPSATPILGKPAGTADTFSVIDRYDPSGYMGDIDDISVSKQGNMVKFTYSAHGGGKHEWDYKYVNCSLNSDPARFAGIMFLDPPNNFGNVAGGYDLRGFKTVKWDARSLNGDAYVEFLIGGVTWQWVLDSATNCWRQGPANFSDSMPRTSFGSKLLTDSSQSFEFSLSDLPEEDLRDVLGGFGWIVSWMPNGIVLNDMATPPAPLQSKTIVIEVSNIRYEK